jgi:hypothetical protein
MTDEPANLSRLVSWFRHEWHAEMGSGRIHVRDTDEGGAPDWHQRFKDLINETDLHRFPMRYHLDRMSRSSTRGSRRAVFLFRLACSDFDVLSTVRATSPAGYDEHGEEWALDYAEASLRRLYRQATDVSVNDPDSGRPRRYLPRVGKSEAQHRAEEAA